MNRISLIPLIIVLLLIACSSDDATQDPNANQESPAINPTINVSPTLNHSPTPSISPGVVRFINESPAELMANVAKDARGFEYIDINALRDDGDLEPLYLSVKQANAFPFINTSDLEIFCASNSMHGSVYIVLGSFDPNDVEKELDNTLPYDDYNNVKLYYTDNRSTGMNPVMAVISNSIVMGDGSAVRDFIEVNQGKAPSLYNDPNFADIIERLPAGSMMICHKSYHIGYFEYDGLSVYGISINKNDESTLGINAVLKCTDVQTASALSDEIVSDMRNNDRREFQNIMISQEDEYLYVTSEEPIPSGLRRLFVFSY